MVDAIVIEFDDSNYLEVQMIQVKENDVALEIYVTGYQLVNHPLDNRIPHYRMPILTRHRTAMGVTIETRKFDPSNDTAVALMQHRAPVSRDFVSWLREGNEHFRPETDLIWHHLIFITHGPARYPNEMRWFLANNGPQEL